MAYDIASGPAAKLLGVHQSTVKTWAEEGKLPGLKTPGGHWRFNKDDLDRFLDAHRNEAAS